MSAVARRLGPACAALLLFGCSDSPNEPRPLEPARIALSATFSETAGGTVEAYTRSNTLWLQFLRSSTVVVEETFAFDGNAAEVRVPIEVPLRETTESLRLQLELRRDADAIFRGAANVQLTAGRTAEIELPLQPVVASVDCTGPEVLLDAFGATEQLEAFALFATGDTIPNPAFTWSAAGAAAITVGATTGLVTARADGSASVSCTLAGLNSSRTVRVFAVVTSVAVAPPTATVLIGATRAFTATLRDRLDNIITGRTVTWTSARPTVASVNTTGTALGLTADTTHIVATVGAVSDSALLTVMHPPPVVTTTAATRITGSSATVNGTVNPAGAPTTAWFEYGTSPTLATSDSTTAPAVGSGNTAVPVTADLANLSAGTTYYFRSVASSAGGTTRGAILSFTTLSTGPPTVTTVRAYFPPVGTTFTPPVIAEGVANPNGLATEVYFEFSPYDSTLKTNYYATSGTDCIDSPVCSIFAYDTTAIIIPAGKWEDVPFSEGIFDDPCEGSGNWVRAVATNALGTVRGNIFFLANRACTSFTTTPDGGYRAPPKLRPRAGGNDDAPAPAPPEPRTPEPR